MAKKAVYLDARERKLVRDVFSSVVNSMTDSLRTRSLNVHEKMALDYTRTEMRILSEKFEEQEPEEDSTE